MLYRVALATVCLFFTTNALAETYTFGVVPQQAAKRLAQLWTPILEHISEESGHKLTFATAKNIPTFEERLKQGAYDFAYMNPYHYTVYSQVPGYKALAKRIDQKIRGIIVAHKDSTFQNLEDLNNQTLAFPSPAAFAATILPQAQLKAAGINFTPKYVSSHDSVYLTVSKLLFPAGGGVVRTLNNTGAEVSDNLRILWKTDAYTPHAIAAHPKIPADVISDIQAAMENMVNTEKGKALLQSIKVKNGLEAASDSDWDDVRALNINIIK